MMKTEFRLATKEDIPLILSFIRELAEYEQLSNEVTATTDILEESLFGEKPAAEVVFAIEEGKEVGFALWFHNFSTFVGRPGLYLEDLYVKPGYRKKGIGKALMEYCIRIARERNCGRMEWWVLKWNPAIKFYEQLGAVPMDEWVVYRLTEEKIRGFQMSD